MSSWLIIYDLHKCLSFQCPLIKDKRDTFQLKKWKLPMHFNRVTDPPQVIYILKKTAMSFECFRDKNILVRCYTHNALSEDF